MKLKRDRSETVCVDRSIATVIIESGTKVYCETIGDFVLVTIKDGVYKGGEFYVKDMSLLE